MPLYPELPLNEVIRCYEDLCGLPLRVNAYLGRDDAGCRVSTVGALWKQTTNWQIVVFPSFDHLREVNCRIDPHIVITHFHDDWGNTAIPKQFAAALREKREHSNAIWPFLACTCSYLGQLSDRKIEDLLGVFDMVFCNGRHMKLFNHDQVSWNIAIAMWNTFVAAKLVVGEFAFFDDEFEGHVLPHIDIRRQCRFEPGAGCRQIMNERHQCRVTRLKNLGTDSNTKPPTDGK